MTSGNLSDEPQAIDNEDAQGYALPASPTAG